MEKLKLKMIREKELMEIGKAICKNLIDECPNKHCNIENNILRLEKFAVKDKILQKKVRELKDINYMNDGQVGFLNKVFEITEMYILNGD